MNRHTLPLTLVAGLLVAAAGCSAPKEDAKKDKGLELTIVFKDNGQGGCVGTVSDAAPKAQRKQWIYWGLQNQTCANWQADKVSLAFDDDFVNTKNKGVENGTQTIRAQVSKDKKDAPDGAHKYTINYDSKAGGDPEVDVSGDCSTCNIP